MNPFSAYSTVALNSFDIFTCSKLAQSYCAYVCVQPTLLMSAICFQIFSFLPPKCCYLADITGKHVVFMILLKPSLNPNL